MAGFEWSDKSETEDLSPQFISQCRSLIRTKGEDKKIIKKLLKKEEAEDYIKGKLCMSLEAIEFVWMK